MRTIAIAALMLSCKPMTSVPHDWGDKNFFVTVAKQENKIQVVDTDGAKYPAAVHYVQSKNSYEIVEQMSELSSKLTLPDILLRWEKLVLTFQDSDSNEYTCVVSPDKAKSFHDDSSDEQKVTIDAKACGTDQQLFTFARLCRKEGGKIITAADLTSDTSYYNGFYIKLWPNNFACVVKRAGKEIPIPSYCFVDKYQSRNTMSSVFKDTDDSSDTEHLVKAVFRKIEPYTNQIKAPARKSCRYGRRIHNIHKIGYQYKVGAGEDLEAVTQPDETQQKKEDD